MAILFMLMGLPGSGKTMLGRRLEQDHAGVLLSPDVWMARIVGDGYDAARRQAVKSVQTGLATRLLALGCNVVLEFGFLGRAERDQARALAASVGAEARLIFLDPPMTVLQQRIAARNAALPPDDFPVSFEHLALCATWLERPAVDEALWPGGQVD